MNRIYEAAAYRTPLNCWWRDSAPPAELPSLDTDVTSDVVVIGGGFTGLNAALVLAGGGRGVTVLDAEQPGWGASGRNGGFCCLGGSKASSAMLTRRYGAAELAAWRLAEQAAVAHVAGLIDAHGLDVDRHSRGETLLAHSPSAMQALRASVAGTAQDYGVQPALIEREELEAQGLRAGFYGGVTLPIGFALNPGKYHAGLRQLALQAGVRLFGETPATAIRPDGSGWRVIAPQGSIVARQVIIATNGYSSEDLPPWLRARYMPAQSTIIVTRPISASEQARQGWTSDQMCYDTRILLHYFRLMPDGRFLFGMRGGLNATPRAEASLSRKIRANFHALYPEWRDVEITHEWTGLVCLMRSLHPFAGPVPDMPGVFAALGYHGNGVAMGSYLGARLAETVLGQDPSGPVPGFVSRPPGRFPLGRYRRVLLSPAYAAAALRDG